MIKFTLKCGTAHRFEAWFRSDEIFQQAKAHHQLACPICGDTQISKALMAPSVQTSRKKSQILPPSEIPPNANTQSETISAKAAQTAQQTKEQAAKMLTEARAERAALQKAFHEIRESILKNTQDVGNQFAEKARKMHEGSIEQAPIRGKASTKEAKQLQEDGIHFGILPNFTDEDVN